jgi:sodium transport system permease protein
MSWNNVRLIFAREVRDQLRDRRTLFMMAVLPILLYPALGIGMMQMLLLFQEQPRTVLILGSKNLPEQPPLLKGERFTNEWFHSREDRKSDLPLDTSESSKLIVLTDTGLIEPAEGAAESTGKEAAKARSRDHMTVRERIVAALPAIRKNVERRAELDRLHDEADARKKYDISAGFADERIKLNTQFGKQLEELGVQAVVLVPEGFAQGLTDAVPTGNESATAEVPVPRVAVYYDSANDKSAVAEMRIKSVLRNWEQELLSRRLVESGLPDTWTKPVNPDRKDLAGDAEISASVWSRMFPALLVVWAVTGAFYPAIDLAAGEKERGTMETLLICPAKRSEIVLGKFFTVMMFSVSTALLNLLSMGMTSKYMASVAGGAVSKLGDLQPPAAASMVWVVLLVLPLAALFSALCLSLATFARSTKEGQYYLTPLLMVTLGLTVFCMSPGIEITPFYSVSPVIGVALLLRQVLAAPGAMAVLIYAIPVLITSFAYAGLALWWAIEQFSREEVLFREAERFDLRLWVKSVMRDKGPTPSFAEAGMCFVMIMLLQFGVMKFMQDRLRGTTKESMEIVMLQLLMIQQVAIIAAPALLMGAILTTSLRQTLSLKWPDLSVLLAGAVLALCLHPISLAVMTQLDGFFPPLPESAVAAVRAMADSKIPVGLTFLAFAVAPGICEELAFRGFILSGFRENHRNGVAIVFSSLAFGLMHMIPQQAFNAALLGMVLGLIAVRSGSLLPGVVFHIIYNGLQIVRSRLDADVLEKGPFAAWFEIEREGGHAGIGYSRLTLAVCVLVATPLLVWLFYRGRGRGPGVMEQEPAESVYSMN